MKIKKTTKFRVDKKHQGSPLARTISEFEERYPDLRNKIQIRQEGSKVNLNITLNGISDGLEPKHIIEFAALMIDAYSSYNAKSDETWEALNLLKETLDLLKKA